MAGICRLKLPLIAALALVAFVAVRHALAEDKPARGKATAVTNVSLTVKVGDRDMTFDVDDKTVVHTEGGGRQANAAGATATNGVKLTSLVQAGETVIVTYRDAKGRNLATAITRILSTGSGRSESGAVNVALGTVKSITNSSLVMTSDGKDTTFSIDQQTVVVGPGAPMMDGRSRPTSSVNAGDTARVSYRTGGGTMRAVEIRITATSR